MAVSGAAMEPGTSSFRLKLSNGTQRGRKIRRFLLERVQPYPVRLVNWFMSK
jgi:hypothetical protein